MGVEVGGWVGEATMLRESNCKRNESCTGERKHVKERNLKNLGHIRAIFARKEILLPWGRNLKEGRGTTILELITR